EMTLAGTTSVGEFNYLHHPMPGGRQHAPHAMALALREAAADAGLRLTLLDTCYLAGGIDEPPTGAQKRFADADATAWARRADALAEQVTAQHVRMGAAVHSVRAVPPDALPTVAAWAAGRAAPLHVHLSEQPAENEQTRGRFG